MVRDLRRLQSEAFDILVIGGGIHGACVAWDASLRGLSVALVERGDFGHAASANSLKIMHGGLRYLQEANLHRMRIMVRERRTWLRIAPRLVRPLPFILPTDTSLRRKKAAIIVAFAVNELVSFDRNQGLPPESHIPACRILSREEFLSQIPGLPSKGVTGGVMWHDAQVMNSERLLLSILSSAVSHGAAVANYSKAVSFRRDDSHWRIRLRDTLDASEYSISAHLIVNCAGAWSGEVLGSLNEPKPIHPYRPSLAFNLLTRQVLPDVAVGLPSRFRGTEQVLFITPWQGYSLIGTWHTPFGGRNLDPHVEEGKILACLEEINAAYPVCGLTRKDVYLVQAGFLPAHPSPLFQGPVRLVRESAVFDHARFGDSTDLITVLGVKYTTARLTAERAVDLALRKLGYPYSPCRTDRTEVAGNLNPSHAIPGIQGTLLPVWLESEEIQRLVREYGPNCRRLLEYVKEDPSLAHPLSPSDPVLGAEVIHALRCEMAQTLIDVVKRRTALGAAGPPNEAAIQSCAQLCARELGWDEARQAAEVNAVYSTYNGGASILRERTR